MSAWKDMTLGDVLTLQRGFDLPARSRKAGPFPVVSSSGVTGSHSEFKVEPPGVVIGRYGSLGSVFWVTEQFWPLNTALWVRDFKGNDERFVSYLLQTVAMDGSTASAVPGVNRNHLHKLSVRLPDLRTQRRIAALLSAFDELIEINDRRIQLLADLARSLYREWFVHLRFPGHEDVEFVDSELGQVPAGWPVQPVVDVLNVIGGGTPSKKEPAYWEGGIPWFTPSDLTQSGRRFAVDPESTISELGLQKSSAKLFPAGSVLMTSRATLGVLAIASEESTVNQGFIVIPPTPEIPAAFIYEWLDHQRDALAQIATGATFKEITKGAFKRFPFLLPPEGLLALFHEITRPLLDNLKLLEHWIGAVARTRDLLLPRLITGRLDISDIDLGPLTPLEAE